MNDKMGSSKVGALLTTAIAASVLFLFVALMPAFNSRSQHPEKKGPQAAASEALMQIVDVASKSDECSRTDKNGITKLDCSLELDGRRQSAQFVFKKDAKKGGELVYTRGEKEMWKLPAHSFVVCNGYDILKNRCADRSLSQEVRRSISSEMPSTQFRIKLVLRDVNKEYFSVKSSFSVKAPATLASPVRYVFSHN